MVLPTGIITPLGPVFFNGHGFASFSADWQVRGKAETLLRGIDFAICTLALPFRALEAVNVQPYLASPLLWCRGMRLRGDGARRVG
jgi:hypothetical protein